MCTFADQWFFIIFEENLLNKYKMMMENYKVIIISHNEREE